MLSANNLLRPQDGGPVTVPTQDMVLGSYYLTYERIGKAETGAAVVYVDNVGETGLFVGAEVDADEFLAANKAAKDAGKQEATFLPTHGRLYQECRRFAAAAEFGVQPRPSGRHHAGDHRGGGRCAGWQGITARVRELVKKE